MTTGATGQLGLALPVQGELSGTWGDTVNNGITQYTNIAIAGTLTLTGDGAVTLANTTGDASASNITSTLAGAGTVTAQFAIVKVSGTTTTKVVTGPSYSKTYVVDNASSFAVTFKASGQTGVSIAAAEKVTVVFNGTDYIKLAGTIANAAGSNTQIQFNNGGLFGASANLTWDGTTLSSTQVNITGQGSLRLQDTTGGEYVGLRAPASLGASYTLTWPADDGILGQALITDGSGALSWSTSASGDVYGPASATDNALARFDGTTGKLLQDSVVIVGDTGAVTGVTDLTASGAVTLSGGTANGVTYLNGSKVLTSGSALTFDGSKLTVKGGNAAQFVLDNANEQYVQALFQRNATANTGADLLLDGSGNTFNFRNLAANMPFVWHLSASAGAPAEQMRLTSTGLGIGTSSPQNKFVVSNAGAAGFEVDPAAISGATYSLFINRSTSAWIDDIRRASTYQWRDSAGTERMRLDSAGNLGLGVTPSAWSAYKVLQINNGSFTSSGTNAFVGSNWYYNGTADTYIATDYATLYRQYQGVHSWLNAPSGTAGNAISFTQAMTLASSGNLLLGTTTESGSGRLRVVNSVRIADSSSETNALLITTTATAATIETRYVTPLVFGVGAAEAARIDSSGNLLVGDTTNSRGARLRIEGQETAYFTGYGNGYGIGLWMTPNASSGGGTATAISFQNVSNATVGTISTTASATAYNTSSDYRLKNTIAPMTGALAKVALLKPCTYKWNADGSDGEGFIAHELAEVVPQCVTGEKDAVDEEGNPKYQGIDTSFLVATLTAAIQEQQAIIESLKARLDAANL